MVLLEIRSGLAETDGGRGRRTEEDMITGSLGPSQAIEVFRTLLQVRLKPLLWGIVWP